MEFNSLLDLQQLLHGAGAAEHALLVRQFFADGTSDYPSVERKAGEFGTASLRSIAIASYHNL